MSKTNPSCPVCHSRKVHGWFTADRFGQCVLFYYECEACGRQAGFCDEATALALWNTLTEREYISRLENFIREHVCARCKLRGNRSVCRDCVTREVLNCRVAE